MLKRADSNRQTNIRDHKADHTGSSCIIRDWKGKRQGSMLPKRTRNFVTKPRRRKLLYLQIFSRECVNDYNSIEDAWQP